MDDNFIRNDFVLATVPIVKAHTGDEIANKIEECIIGNGLSMNKLVSMVRDDASNMVRSCRLLDIERF